MKHLIILFLFSIFSTQAVLAQAYDFKVQELANYNDDAAEKLLPAADGMLLFKTWKEKKMGRTYILGIEKYNSEVQLELDKEIKKYGKKFRYQQEWANGEDIYLFFSAKDKKKKKNTIHLLVLDAQSLKMKSPMRKIGTFNYIIKAPEFHGFSTSSHLTKTGFAVTFTEHHMKKKKLSGIVISMNKKGEVVLSEAFEKTFKSKPIFLEINHCYAGDENEMFVALKVFSRGTLRNPSAKLSNYLVAIQKEKEVKFKEIYIKNKGIEEFRILDYSKAENQLLLIGNYSVDELTKFVATYHLNPFDDTELELVDQLKINVLESKRKDEFMSDIYISDFDILETEPGYTISGVQTRPTFRVVREHIFLNKNHNDAYFFNLDKTGNFTNHISFEKKLGETQTLYNKGFSFSIFMSKDKLRLKTFDKELKELSNQLLLKDCKECDLIDSEYDPLSGGIYALIKKRKGKMTLYYLSKD